MQNNKLKPEWVKEWSIDDIISNANSQGMGFQVSKISLEDFRYNKKVLIKELEERLKNNLKK